MPYKVMLRLQASLTMRIANTSASVGGNETKKYKSMSCIFNPHDLNLLILNSCSAVNAEQCDPGECGTQGGISTFTMGMSVTSTL